MDWHPISAGHGKAPSATAPERPDHLPWPRPPAAREQRLDLALTAAIDRLAELVLSGIQVAAVHPGQAPSVTPPAELLAVDVGILVQLVRLATAAGVVLPNGLSAASPLPPATLTEHLGSCHAGYVELAKVLTRLDAADDVALPTRDEAQSLLRRVEDHLSELAGAVPRDDTPAGGPRLEPQPPRGAFLPGELLG